MLEKAKAGEKDVVMAGQVPAYGGATSADAMLRARSFGAADRSAAAAASGTPVGSPSHSTTAVRAAVATATQKLVQAKPAAQIDPGMVHCKSPLRLSCGHANYHLRCVCF